MNKRITDESLTTETHNGMITVSAIVNGYLVFQRYVGFTPREARDLFRQFVEEKHS